MKRLMLVVIAILFVFATGVSYAQGPAPTPAKVQRVLASAIGTWTVSEGTDEPMGTIAFRWAPGKHYVIMDGQFGTGAESFTSSATMSWDRATTDGIILHVVSLLGHSTEHIKIVSETVSQGESTGVTLDQKDSAKTRTMRQGPDRFTIHYTDVIVGGQKQPDNKIVFSRVKPTSDEAELLRLEDELAAAVLKRDMAVLNRLEADDFTIGTTHGTLVTKEQTHSFIQSDAFNLTSLTCEDLKVKVYGDMAVITGVLKWSDADSDGGRNLITDIWLKRNGRWQMVASHESEIEKTVAIAKLSPELKKLEAFVGDWVYEGEQVDPPVAGLPYGPAGKYSGTITTRPILGGRFLESKLEDKNPGGVTRTLRVIGYDPKAKQYVVNAFLSDGSRQTTVQTPSPDGRTWTIEANMTSKEGKTLLIRSTIEFSADGTKRTDTTEVSPDEGKTWKYWCRDTSRKVSKP